MILASQIWTDVFWTSVVAGGLLAGLPLMFTALGETISERAGVLNIGLEGMMLLGAYARLPRRVLRRIRLGRVPQRNRRRNGRLGRHDRALRLARPRPDRGRDRDHARRRGDHERPPAGPVRLHLPAARRGADGFDPAPDRLPVLGTSLFEQPPLVYLAFAFVGALAWVFRRTNVGLNLRAAGEKPEALDAAGVSVVATRSWAVLSTGALAGLGGAYLSIVAAGIFTPFITQGQGFMAIVIAMLGRGRPLWVLLGSFLFGIALSLSDSLQLAGINISTDVVNMLPFATIIIALIAVRPPLVPPARPCAAVRPRRALKGEPMRDPDFTLSAGPVTATPARARGARLADRLPLRPGVHRALPRDRAQARRGLPDEERRPAHAGRGGARARGRGAGARAAGHEGAEPRPGSLRQGHGLLAEGLRRGAARARGRRTTTPSTRPTSSATSTSNPGIELVTVVHSETPVGDGLRRLRDRPDRARRAAR